MKNDSSDARLRRNLRRLFGSLEFVSRPRALERGGLEARRFAEIYQQLGFSSGAHFAKCAPSLPLLGRAKRASARPTLPSECPAICGLRSRTTKPRRSRFLRTVLGADASRG